MTNQDKIERYDLIIGYFNKILQQRADKLQDKEIYYDGMKQARYMNEEERNSEVVDDFLSEMDDLGFYEFAELIAHDFNGETLSLNNQFYDHVYGDR
jgi:hypothetical protein